MMLTMVVDVQSVYKSTDVYVTLYEPCPLTPNDETTGTMPE